MLENTGAGGYFGGGLILHARGAEEPRGGPVFMTSSLVEGRVLA